MEILIAFCIVFIVFSTFAQAGTKQQVKPENGPTLPAGYVVIAPSQQTEEQHNSGCATLLMLWGMFTIFLFILIFS